eukprot:gene35394-biopygen89426
MIRSVEDCLALGLWRIPYDTGMTPAPLRDNTGAGHQGIDVLPNVVINRLFPLLADFWFTRSFCNGMRQREAALQSAVRVAEEVGEQLAGYDTDAAHGLLDGEDADYLPPRLLEALYQLIENLDEYRPFLPQSCIPDFRAPDDGKGSSDRPRVDAYDGFGDRMLTRLGSDLLTPQTT